MVLSPICFPPHFLLEVPQCPKLDPRGDVLAPGGNPTNSLYLSPGVEWRWGWGGQEGIMHNVC